MRRIINDHAILSLLPAACSSLCIPKHSVLTRDCFLHVVQTYGPPMPQAADAADVLRLVNGELIISTRVRIDGALAVGAGIAANGSATGASCLGGARPHSVHAVLAASCSVLASAACATSSRPSLPPAVRRDLSVHGRTLLGDDGIPVALSVMGQAQLDATTVTGPLTVQGTASRRVRSLAAPRL